MSRKKQKSSETATEVFPSQLQKLMDREPKTSQTKLAEALNIQRQTVSNYANGQSSPDWKTLSRIADYFGVSVDWLLGRTQTETPDADMQAVCEYTGLSEDAIELIKKEPRVSKVLNTLSQHDKSIYNSLLFRFAVSLRHVESEAVKVAAFVISEKPGKTYVDASMKKDALSLALFQFSELCRKIPDKFMSSDLLDIIDDQRFELYQAEMAQYMADQIEIEEAENGKH